MRGGGPSPCSLVVYRRMRERQRGRYCERTLEGHENMTIHNHISVCLWGLSKLKLSPRARWGMLHTLRAQLFVWVCIAFPTMPYDDSFSFDKPQGHTLIWLCALNTHESYTIVHCISHSEVRTLISVESTWPRTVSVKGSHDPGLSLWRDHRTQDCLCGGITWPRTVSVEGSHDPGLSLWRDHMT